MTSSKQAPRRLATAVMLGCAVLFAGSVPIVHGGLATADTSTGDSPEVDCYPRKAPSRTHIGMRAVRVHEILTTSGHRVSVRYRDGHRIVWRYYESCGAGGLYIKYRDGRVARYDGS